MNIRIGSNITLMVISFVNLTLHSIGVYMISCMYKNGHRTVRNILLLNLISAEIIYNLLMVPYAFTGVLLETYNIVIIEKLHLVLELLLMTSGYCLYYVSMVYLTLDRLLASILNIHYRHMCTKGKIKKVLIPTWILGLFSCLLTVVLEMNGQTRTILRLHIDTIRLITSVLNVVFFNLAVVSYGIMFVMFAISRRNVSPNETRESLCTIFSKSKFYTSVLLVSSFLVLTVIPSVISLILRTYDIQEVYMLISRNFSFTVDAVIYIFMQASVRKLLYKKFHLTRLISNVPVQQSLSTAALSAFVICEETTSRF